MKSGIKIWDIVHYIGILLLFIAVTVGLLFMTKGSLAMSVVGGVLISAVFFGIVEWLKCLKQANEFQDRKRGQEYALLIGGYGIAFLLTFPIILHFLNVNIGAKNDIKKALNEESEYILEMVSEYEKHVESIGEAFDTEIRVALNKVGTEKNAFIEQYKLDGIKTNTIDVFVTSMKTKLLNELDNVRSVYDDQAASLSNASDSFSPLEVPTLYHDMKIRSKKLRNDLTDISKSNTRGRETPFEYKENKDSLGDISNPRALFGLTNWLYTLLGLGILHFMLLSSYIFEDRAANTLVDNIGGKETGFRM